MTSTLTYRPATLGDAAPLAAMAARCFTETFGQLYAPADLATFLDQAFGPAGLPVQLADPAFRIEVATEGDAIAGFAKLGPVAFPGDWPAGAIELYQLYVLAGWQGVGVGPTLMDWAIGHARAAGYSDLMLSVYVDNRRARRFYERYGFVEVGRYTFMVGNQPDDDRILRLPL